MIKKRVNKINWHGNDLDNGKAKAPSIATQGGDGLDGLNEGEIYICDADEDPAIFIKTNKEKVARISGGGEIESYTKEQIDEYLKKKLDQVVWDRNWEEKKDPNGIEYIFTTKPIVTAAGVTMYSGETPYLPSMFEGIPLDGETLAWVDGKIAVVGGIGQGGITGINVTGTGNAVTGASLSADGLTITLTKGSEFALKSDIPSLGGYATQSWVNTQLGSYATTSSLKTVSDKLNNFLEGTDTDGIINKWKELENFLAGQTQTSTLAQLLSGKADKATTLAGYGITDAYTKTEINTVLGDYVTKAGAQDITGVKSFINGLKVGDILVKKHADGVVEIEGDLVVTGGVTMYGIGNHTASTILDALPIDSATLSKEGGKLTVIGGTGASTGSITLNGHIYEPDSEGNITLPSYPTTLPASDVHDWAKSSTKPTYTFTELTSHPTTIAGYGITDAYTKTEINSTLANYATNASLSAVSNKLNTFLEGTDTDNVINKWKELEAFLSGFTETDTLASALSLKADKSVSITAGAGLTGGGTIAESRTLSLSVSGVTAGTYTKTTVDVYGRVTAGSNLSASDIPSLDWSKIATGKPTTIAGYGITDAYTKNEITTTLGNYVTLEGAQNITGVKSFINGMNIGDISVKKHATGVIEIDGDLIVTGGITMYAQGSHSASTILDALPIDPDTLSKEGGVLSVIGGVGGGSVDGIILNGVTISPDDTTKLITLPNLVTVSTDQDITGTKTFSKTIYQGTSLANRRAVSYVDGSNNIILADINNQTIVRGSKIRFQNVNGSDLATINNSTLYANGNIIGSSYIKTTNGWFQNDNAGQGIMNIQGDARWYYETNFDGWKSDKPISATTKMEVDGNLVLHAGNYLSYTNPHYVKKSGDIISGTLTMAVSNNKPIIFNDLTGRKINLLSFYSSGAAYAAFGVQTYYLFQTATGVDLVAKFKGSNASSSYIAFTRSDNKEGYVGIDNSGVFLDNNGRALYVDSSTEATASFFDGTTHHTLLHTGNAVEKLGTTYVTDITGGNGALIIRNYDAIKTLPITANWTAARNFYISDKDNYYAGTTSSVNGSTNVILHLPEIVSGKSFTANSKRFNECLAFYNSSKVTETGTICITLPNSWNNSMNIYEIYLYEYNSSAASVITIGAYNYSGTPGWVNYRYHTKGAYNKKVRLAYNGSECVILLGETITDWSYPQVYLKSVFTGYSNITKWTTGYSISLITSESGYSYISIPSKAPEYFGDVHSSKFIRDDSSDAYILLGGGGHKSLSSITSEYVTSLSTSGNYLTWTKNGTTNNIVIPYASQSGALKAEYGGGVTLAPSATLIYQYNVSSSYAGLFPYADNANGILSVNTHNGKYFHQLGFSSNGNLYHRTFNNEALNTSKTWVRLLTTGNYTDTLDGRYYTESEADARFVNVTGDTMTGNLIMGDSASVCLLNSTSNRLSADRTNGTFIYYGGNYINVRSDGPWFNNTYHINLSRTIGHGSSSTIYTPDQYYSTYVPTQTYAYAERGSWDYANNGRITTDWGNIHLAGTANYTWSNSNVNYKTMLFITPGSNGFNSPLNYEMLFYSSNGSGYPSGWTRVVTNRNYSSILDARYYTELEADSRFVNATGDTMTGNLNFINDRFIYFNSNTNKAVGSNGTDGTYMQYSSNKLRVTSGDIYYNSNKVWHQGNDGHNSGLDADTLDTHQLFNANGGIPYLVSFPGYYDFGSSTDTSDYLKNIIKWSYDEAKGKNDALLIGVGRPNSLGNIQIQVYGDNSIDATTKYPKYSSAMYISLGGAMFIFGTSEYNYYQYQVAFTSSNVASATKLQTARSINGTYFDGTANITTANWGYTRTLTLTGNASGSVSINGGSNVSISVSNNYATSAAQLYTSRTLWGQSFNGTGNVSGNMTGVGSIIASGGISAGGTISTSSGYLKATTPYGKFIQIGPGNTLYCHFYTDATAGYWFDKSVNIDGGVYPYGGAHPLGTSTSPWRTIYINNWFRSIDKTGWYNETYGGGIYMTDTTYVRVYNNKSFYVPGNILATGGVTMYSDLRKKNVIKEILLPLESMAKADLFDYIFKSDEKGIVRAGTSAQYWNKYLPEVVSKDNEDFFTMDYGVLATVCSLSMAKHFHDFLNNEFHTHETEIETLKRENRDMKRRIEELERGRA